MCTSVRNCRCSTSRSVSCASSLSTSAMWPRTRLWRASRCISNISNASFCKRSCKQCTFYTEITWYTMLATLCLKRKNSFTQYLFYETIEQTLVFTLFCSHKAGNFTMRIYLTVNNIHTQRWHISESVSVHQIKSINNLIYTNIFCVSFARISRLAWLCFRSSSTVADSCSICCIATVAHAHMGITFKVNVKVKVITEARLGLADLLPKTSFLLKLSISSCFTRNHCSLAHL